MKDYEFYRKYANLRLDKRCTILDINRLGIMTLNDLYFELKKIDDKIRDDLIRKNKLLQIVEETKIFDKKQTYEISK